MDSKGRLTETLVDIKGKALCQVLMEINRDLEGLDLLRGEPEVFIKPKSEIICTFYSPDTVQPITPLSLARGPYRETPEGE